MKVLSTVDVAARCAQACGKKVGDQFVRECYLEMYGIDGVGTGHALHLTEAQAKLVVLYAMEWHGSSRAPGVVEWSKQRGHELPKLRRSLVPVATQPRKAEQEASPAAPASSIVVDVTKLIQRVDRLEQAIATIGKAGVPRSMARRIPARQITDGSTVQPDPRRVRIVRAVNSWVRDRVEVIDYGTAWSEIYRSYWTLWDGQQPVEWFTSELKNDAKLDFFAQHGWLGILADALPEILADLSRRFPIPAAQRELFG